ncbi:MAG: 4-(cytidine 5'-diphospho)-2-C-methyl-D-erythritol kinase [Rhodospirillales bacterium]|nr:4-(cytidine 5'-diphospho)-2-C-methyl-D-erythritol kinase [Rhodospirillales bacterium]
MTGQTTKIRIEAPAKVNLYLRVVGRRSDGYHLLDSLVVFPAIGDTVEVEPADALALEVVGPFAAAVPPGDDNLVLRAARLLAERAECQPLAKVRLVKRLPVASGIGGGSADAAATLRALARLWEIPAAAVDMPAVALALGADVPMCLAGRPAFVSGIGEHLAPAPPLPSFSLLLANPGVAVATPAVFAGRRGPFSAPAAFSGSPPNARALASLLSERGNDLAASAEALAPEIAAVRAKLAAASDALIAQMSGSGATCFAVFASQGQAEAAWASLAALHPDWWLAAAPVAGSPRNG